MLNEFVAMGDSFTEGIGDEIDGVSLKSWVEYFALLHEPKLKYTNLAKRGLLTKEIREQQLTKALALEPSMVSLIAGANDVLKGKWNSKEYKIEMEYMIDSLSKTGAKILIANLPDFTFRLPLRLPQKQLVQAQLVEANQIIQSLSAKYEFIHFNFWDHPLTKEKTFWSKDRIHPNSKGYLEVANIIYKQLLA
ncbi:MULTISPECIES: SGNH/GDSL hydrolase family protein [Bacillus]|uniref:SGNH/GDSL hydrolase family protein n=1 Tax=Bacillus TaxID=1386 RepID=UPI0002D54D69|nr:MULTISPECIES: SGNH/GDSL hydrolase family protein [Bacillus]